MALADGYGFFRCCGCLCRRGRGGGSTGQHALTDRIELVGNFLPVIGPAELDGLDVLAPRQRRIDRRTRSNGPIIRLVKRSTSMITSGRSKAEATSAGS